MRIWTHPWVLRLDEIRQMNKVGTKRVTGKVTLSPTLSKSGKRKTAKYYI